MLRIPQRTNSGNSFAQIASLVVLVFATVLSSGAQAAVLASYSFFEDDLSPTTIGANVSAGDFGFGPGMSGGSPTFFNTSNFGVPEHGILNRSSGTAVTEAGAIADDDYVTFTVTPDGGFDLDLGALTFNLVASHNGGPDYNPQVAVRSSVDSFATTLGTFTPPNAGPGTPDQSEWSSQTLLLTGAAFQDLNTPVEFRFYMYDDSSEAGNVIRFDNIALHDISFVPEPSTLALCSLAGLGLLMRRRRRRV